MSLKTFIVKWEAQLKAVNPKYDVQYEVSKDEAAVFMEEHKEPYKAEMIKELPQGEVITFYRQGDYEEFCAATGNNYALLEKIYEKNK